MSLVTQYLNYTEGTEPPKQYHRWSFLSCVGAALGRNLYIEHGHSRIYPNMYVMLVGAPGTRKSSSIKTAKKLLELGGYDTFAYNKSTKQKFLLDLEDLRIPKDETGNKNMAAMLEEGFKIPLEPDSTDCFICADEFADFIGTNNFDFITLLTTLWDNLPKYEDRVKNSQSIKIANPTISILGGLTPVSFASSIPQEASGSGFLSRVILVYGESTGDRITWPTVPNADDTDMFGLLFAKLRTLKGEVKFTPEAKRIVESIYTEWEDLTDVRLQYYCSRRLVHLFKVCMILAALHAVTDDLEVVEVNKDVVVEANTILTYTEEYMSNALGELGRSRNSDAAQKVMEKLGSSKKPVSIDELWESVSQDLERPRQLLEVMHNLMKAGKVSITSVTVGAAESEKRFILKKRTSGGKRPHVDYHKYIEEYEDSHEQLQIV